MSKHTVMSKCTLYIAMSEGGFIAGENDNIDFLNDYMVEGEDYGYGEFINAVGSIIVGRRTYDKAKSMDFPYHEDKRVFVATRNSKDSALENLMFYSGDLAQLVAKLMLENDGHIYCDGGADVAKKMISEGLIDEIILSVVPLTLGGGTELFHKGAVPVGLKLDNTKEIESGLIQKRNLL